MIQSLFLVRMRRRGLRKKRDAALRIQASFRGKRARDALRVCQAQSGDGTDAEADETSDYGRGGREANRGRGEDEPSTNSTTGDEARTTISRWRPHEPSTTGDDDLTLAARRRPQGGPARPRVYPLSYPFRKWWTSRNDPQGDVLDDTNADGTCLFGTSGGAAWLRSSPSKVHTPLGVVSGVVGEVVPSMLKERRPLSVVGLVPAAPNQTHPAPHDLRSISLCHSPLEPFSPCARSRGLWLNYKARLRAQQGEQLMEQLRKAHETSSPSLRSRRTLHPRRHQLFTRGPDQPLPIDSRLHSPILGTFVKPIAQLANFGSPPPSPNPSSYHLTHLLGADDSRSHEFRHEFRDAQGVLGTTFAQPRPWPSSSLPGSHEPLDSLTRMTSRSLGRPATAPSYGALGRGAQRVVARTEAGPQRMPRRSRPMSSEIAEIRRSRPLR